MAVNRITVPISKKYPKGVAWEVSIDKKALRIKRKFPTKLEADTLNDTLLARIRKKDYDPTIYQPIPLSRLIQVHLDYIKNRPQHQRIKKILSQFLEIVEKINGKNVSVQSLKKADLMAFIKKRRTKVSNQTINREMNEIKGCLNSGSNHFSDLDEYRCPRIARLPVPEGRQKPQWEDGEAEAIIKALVAPKLKTESEMVAIQRGKLADMFVVCLLTGLRAGEARNLNSSQINFPKKEMRITSLKGKDAKPRMREVPFNQVVFEILWRRAAQGEWIFSNPTNNRPMNDPYKLFRTACDRAGVEYGMAAGKIINGSRHTFATRSLKEFGQDAQAVGAMLGHSVETMVRNYISLKPEQVRAVAEQRGGENFGALLGRQDEATETTEENSLETKGSNPAQPLVFTANS